jgi:hypothetical protein
VTGVAPADEYRRWLRDELAAAVRRLAEAPDRQIEYLRQLGSPVSADELALEFDDVAAAAVAEAHLLSDKQAEIVRQPTDLLSAISGPSRAKLWTPNALRSASEWQEIRAVATQLMDALESPGS